MRRVLVLMPTALALSALLLVGCKAKPSEKACKEAIENVRRISGQGMSDVGADPSAAIRSCRGNSSTKSVECMRTAKTLTDLQACEGDVGEKYFQEAADETKRSAEKNANADKDSVKVEDGIDAATNTEIVSDAAVSDAGGAETENTETETTPPTEAPAPAAETDTP